MMSFFSFLKRYGLYNGLNRDQYISVHDEINFHNRIMLEILSCISTVLFGIIAFLSATLGLIEKNKIEYFIGFSISLFVYVTAKKLKLKKTGFCNFLTLLWMVMFLSVGLIFAVNSSSINEKTTFFLIFPFIGPMFFCIPGFTFSLLTLVFEIIYLGFFFTIGRHTDNFTINVLNSMVFTIAAILCGNITMANKAKSSYHAYENLKTEELESLNHSLRHQYGIIKSISFMFYAVHYGNLEKNTISEITNLEEFRAFVKDAKTPAEMMDLLCEHFISPQYHDVVRPFADPEYLQEELKNKDSINVEFLGRIRGWARIICVPVERKEGKVNRVLWCFENINEQKQREFAAQDQLKKALKDATKADEAKSKFLFSMSHDIRTPMNAILGYATLLNKIPAMDDNQKKYISGIMSSGNQLLGLINSVLETARIESGKMELCEEIVNSKKVKDTVCDIFQTITDSKNLELIVESDFIHEYVYADPVKTNEVILNIVSNAVKYTEKGYVKVLFSELPSEKEGYGIFQLSVIDSGIGISEDFLPHIFESFSREHTATESKILGTGLGLDITKKLIDLMNGTIEVKSEVGKGTEFICKIPLKLSTFEEYYETHKNEIEDSFDLKGKRILLAEDNDLNADIAMEILSDYGAQVEWAENGEKCVEMLKSRESDYYNVILMDVQMPVMDGLSATKCIRELEDKNLASMTIIAMTANAFEEDKKTCLAAGMNGFIAKPIQVPLLIKTLMELS